METFEHLPDYVRALVDSVAQREGFSQYIVQRQPGSKHGDGLQGIMSRLTIRGRRADIGDATLALICKMTPELKERRVRFDTSATFPIEVFCYEQMLSAFRTLQMDKNIAEADQFAAYPKCYATHSNESTGEFAIIMSDLMAAGYRMLDKTCNSDLERTRAVMEQLGRFHAVSFALKLQRPAVFEPFKRMKCNAINRAITKEMPMYENCMVRGLGVLSPADAVFERTKRLRDNFSNVLQECVYPVSDRFSVLNHTDCWNNNLMFRNSPNNVQRASTEVCMLDWQMVQYGSPAINVSFYLYTAVDQRIRAAHYDELMRAYHTSLSVLLTQLGCDAEAVFSFADLTSEMQRNAQVGLIMAFVVLPLVTVDPSHIPDLDEHSRQFADGLPAAQMPFGGVDNVLFTTRLRDAIEDFFSRDFLLSC